MKGVYIAIGAATLLNLAATAAVAVLVDYRLAVQASEREKADWHDFLVQQEQKDMLNAIRQTTTNTRLEQITRCP